MIKYIYMIKSGLSFCFSLIADNDFEPRNN